MAILKPDATTTIFGVTVNEFLLTKHNPNHIDMPYAVMNYEGVTVHNTDDLIGVHDDAEQYTRATYNGNMNDVRVHYYVDDVCAWQNLPLTLSGWHAADGSGFGNRKTVAIECIMTGAYNAEDKKAEDNCARLAAYLLFAKGYGIDRLYTHTYHLNVKAGRTGSVDYLNTAKGNYKYCPIYILPHWAAFKAKVQGYLDELNGKKAPAVVTPAPQGQIYRIRKSWSDVKSQVGAYRNLASAKTICAKNPGYAVFDEKGNVVYSNTPKLEAGAKITLNYAPFFVSSTSKSPARNGVSGTYYVWSATVINQRIRITTRPDWAGVSGKCTAWVPVSSCTVI